MSNFLKGWWDNQGGPYLIVLHTTDPTYHGATYTEGTGFKVLPHDEERLRLHTVCEFVIGRADK